MPQIYWNTLQKINMDKVEGVSIREYQKLGIRCRSQKLAKNLIQFLTQAVETFMVICIKEIYLLMVREI